jgi:hypoxanthine phosphoribosyltransferase
LKYASTEKLGLKPFELLLDQNKIAQRIAELGREITTDYKNETPVVIGVLKGCIVFLADLIRHIKLPLELDFVTAASYRKANQPPERILVGGGVSVGVEGRHVLVVEGVVDSGRTVAAILKELNKMKPASVAVVTLIDKPTCHRVKLDIKYKGFSLGNDFVIGYGLDNTQKYRNLPFIGRLVEPK